jgi:eukaryotic-like serine/threonine-protein kinase
MTAPEISAALPQYDVAGELGRGAMGVVLAGTHRSLGRRVAIKQLPPQLATDPAVRARFTSEARLLAGLQHPHVVPVYDYAETPQACVLVLELLSGGSVWDTFARDGLTPEASCAIGLAVLAGLSAAHTAGVLHRDIKPENVLISSSGVPKVGDFGIATVIGGDETLATENGQVLGTPAYMSPEQARGERLGPPTDIYATATMLYELLSGRLPIPDDGEVVDVVQRHATSEPAPLPDTVPQPIAAVVMHGLVNRVADRFPDADSFAVALAGAAAQSFGVGWIERSGIPVQLSATVLQAASVAISPSSPAAEPVRPGQAQHRSGLDVAELGEQPLVPVARLLEVPPRPIRQGVGVAVLIVLAAILALVGPHAGLGGHGGPAVSIDGRGASTTPLSVDLSKPLRVAVRAPDSGPDQVTVSTTTASVPTGSSTATATGHGGVVRVRLKPGAMRWLVGGRILATVKVSHGGVSLGQRRVLLDSTHPFIATAEGIIAVLALLAGAAYAESSLRQLRRRRARATARMVTVVAGAVAGIGGWLLISLAVPRAPALATGIGCAILTGAAGAVATSAAAVIGKRRRVARR